MSAPRTRAVGSASASSSVTVGIVSLKVVDASRAGSGERLFFKGCASPHGTCFEPAVPVAEQAIFRQPRGGYE